MYIYLIKIIVNSRMHLRRKLDSKMGLDISDSLERKTLRPKYSKYSIYVGGNFQKKMSTRIGHLNSRNPNKLFFEKSRS